MSGFDLAVGLCALSMLGAGVVAWSTTPGGSFLGAVARACAALRLRPDPRHLLGVRGVVHGRGLRLRHRHAAIEICTEDGPPLGIALGPGPGFATGDPAFDAAVAVDAAEELRILALLDGETRLAVAAAVRDGATFDGRRFLWRVEADPHLDGRTLATRIRAVADAHRRLLARAGASATDALGDRSEGVRVRAVEALARAGRLEDAAARAALHRAGSAAQVADAALRRDREALREMVGLRGRTAVRAALALVRAGLWEGEDRRRLEEVLVDALVDEQDGPQAATALVPIGSAVGLAALRAAGAAEAAATLAARLAEAAGGLALARSGALALASDKE